MSNETDLDWLARNVHVWPAGDHQPWCYVYWKGGQRAVIGNCITVIQPCVRVEMSDWLARRAELQNKPRWEDAPEWAEFLGQDDDGVWFWHGEEPNSNGEDANGCLYWMSHGLSDIACRGELRGDWRDTLEKRPEEFKPSIEEANMLSQEFKPFTSIEDNQGQDMTQQHDMKQDNGWFERGELPPVGARCIVLLGIAPKANCEVIAKTARQMVVKWEENGLMDVIDLDVHVAFRPILTERDVLLSIIVEEMNRYDTDGKLADAILAAGFSLRDK